MLKTLLRFAVLFCVPLALLAQEAPQVEVFAGYSYLRAHDSLSEGVNQNGWDFSVATNFARSFGVVADFSNHYGTTPRVFTQIGTGGKGVTFLFGPQYSYRRAPRVTPFVHALFGGMQANKFVPSTMVIVPGGGGIVVPPAGCTTIFCYESETAFAMALGGGLDVKATHHVWVRAFQVEYLRANLTYANQIPATQNDLRVSAGIVVRFGRR
jgi:opacity protein-like surface antigen